MSWKDLTWAGDQRCRTSAEKFVLVMLANHSDEQHTCYPLVETLAKETQLGESTVRRCITNLAIDGKIRVLQRWAVRGSRRSNRYQLLVAGADTPLPEHGDWQREYEYAPKPQDIDNGEPGEADEDIPLGSSGMSDQGVNTARIERYADHTAQSERYIPLGSRGYNRSDREVTSNRNESSVVNPQEEPPLPPGDQLTDGAPASTEEGGDSQIEEPPGELTVVVAWFDRHSDWQRGAIEEALIAAVAQGRGNLRRCATALKELLQGVHGPTVSPRRLLVDGPWWKTTPAGLGRSRRDGPRCEKRTHGREPADGCILCRGEKIGGLVDEPLPEVTDEQRLRGERELDRLLARQRQRRSPEPALAGT